MDSMGRATFSIPDNARGQASISLKDSPTWLNVSPSPLIITLIEPPLASISAPEFTCPVEVWRPSAYLLDENSQHSLTCSMENIDDIAFPFTLTNTMMTVASDGTLTVSSLHSTLPARGTPIDLDFEFDTPLAGIIVDEDGLWINFTFTIDISGPYHVPRTIDYTIQVHITPPELIALHVSCDANVSAPVGESSIQDLTCTIINLNGVTVTFSGSPSWDVGTSSAHVHSSLPIGVSLPPGHPGMTLSLQVTVTADPEITTLPIHFILESRSTGWISFEQSIDLTIDIDRPQEEDTSALIDDTNDTVTTNVSDLSLIHISEPTRPY